MYKNYVHLLEKIAFISERQERLHSNRSPFFLKKLLSDAISDDGTLSFFYYMDQKSIWNMLRPIDQNVNLLYESGKITPTRR